MFTIKQITTLGNESLYLATEVGYFPYETSKPVPAPEYAENVPLEARVTYGDLTGQVWYTTPHDNQYRELIGGTIYVMNDHGATVSKWDLGGWAKPQHAGDAEQCTGSACRAP